MRFMMLVKHNENLWGPPPKEFMDAMGKLSEEAVKAGTMVASGGLAPTALSKRVRLSQGRLTVIDGPFTESREIIGGFWMLQVKSREEAIEWARRVPSPTALKVELRQVHELTDFPADLQNTADTSTVRAQLEKEGGLVRLAAGLRREKAVDFAMSRAKMTTD